MTSSSMHILAYSYMYNVCMALLAQARPHDVVHLTSYYGI